MPVCRTWAMSPAACLGVTLGGVPQASGVLEWQVGGDSGGGHCTRIQQERDGASCHKTSPLQQGFTRPCCACAEFVHAWVLTEEGLAAQGKMPRTKSRIRQVLEGEEDLN